MAFAGIALGRFADNAPFFCTRIEYVSCGWETVLRAPTKHSLEGHTPTEIVKTITNLFVSRKNTNGVAVSYPIALPHEHYRILCQEYKPVHDHCTAFLKGCQFSDKKRIENAQCLFLDLTPRQVAAKLVHGKISNGFWQFGDRNAAALTILGSVDELSIEDVVEKLIIPTVSNLDAVRCIGVLKPEDSFPNLSLGDLKSRFSTIPLVCLSVADLSYGSARMAEDHAFKQLDIWGEQQSMVTDTPLGVRLADGRLITLPIGSTIPTTRVFYFTTSKDDQTTAELQFYNDNRSCGRVMFEGLTPRARGAARIKIVVQRDFFLDTIVTVQEVGSAEKTTVILQQMTSSLSGLDEEFREINSIYGIDGVIGELPE
jgi:hypothetical protein